MFKAIKTLSSLSGDMFKKWFASYFLFIHLLLSPTVNLIAVTTLLLTSSLHRCQQRTFKKNTNYFMLFAFHQLFLLKFSFKLVTSSESYARKQVGVFSQHSVQWCNNYNNQLHSTDGGGKRIQKEKKQVRQRDAQGHIGLFQQAANLVADLRKLHSIILARCKTGCKPGFQPGLQPGFQQVRAGLRHAVTRFRLFLSKTWSRTCCINLDVRSSLGFKQVCSWLSTCFQHAFYLLATCFRHAHANQKPGLQPGLQLARIMECGLYRQTRGCSPCSEK